MLEKVWHDVIEKEYALVIGVSEDFSMSHFVSFASEPLCLSPNMFGMIIDCMKALSCKVHRQMLVQVIR